MTLTEKLAALPPYLRTMGELAAIEGESSKKIHYFEMTESDAAAFVSE